MEVGRRWQPFFCSSRRPGFTLWWSLANAAPGARHGKPRNPKHRKTYRVGRRQQNQSTPSNDSTGGTPASTTPFKEPDLDRIRVPAHNLVKIATLQHDRMNEPGPPWFLIRLPMP